MINQLAFRFCETHHTFDCIKLQPLFLGWSVANTGWPLRAYQELLATKLITFTQNLGHSLGPLYAEAQEGCLL